MKLYHGSLQIVKEPQIIIPDRTLDYGVGFYTTTSSKQSKEWTIRKLKGKKVGYVNVYEFDEKSVFGPVANDRVYAAFALYENGLLNKQELIAELKTYKLIDQVLFHTERALETLTFIKATEVKL